MSTIENFTFDELTIGQTSSYSKNLTEDDVILFAKVSGDVNPVHLDAEFAATTIFKERIAHGAWTGSIVSAAIALQLPGPGTIYLGQSLKFRAPVKIGDTITITLEITEKKEGKNFVVMDCTARNQHGKTVASGTAEVLAPTEKVVLPTPILPTVTIDK